MLQTFDAADSHSRCCFVGKFSSHSSSKIFWASAMSPDACIKRVSFTVSPYRSLSISKCGQTQA
jgi:hypothetical protein